MNILFNTQSIGLRVFWLLSRAIDSEVPEGLGKTGFFITNKVMYQQFVEDNPEFVTSAKQVLSEWEILEHARLLDCPDTEYIGQWERRIGDKTLWNAAICDRRFNYSIRAQQVQDYRPAYSHEFILKVLQVALERIDEHFEQVSPNAIIGLNAVTLYDYLYYLIARERGIPYFQLKLTRIQNYVSLYTDPLGVSPHIGDRIERYQSNPEAFNTNEALQREVRTFVEQARIDALSYEGAISKKKKKPKGSKEGAVETSKASWSKRLVNIVFENQQDAHYPTARKSIFYSRIVKPWRHMLIQRLVFQSGDADWGEEHENYRYAVYPLNTEPEVALLVYGRSYRNQIETIRNIASSLPVEWKLVVKEHPNAMGYRNIGYYKKLREIPNVVLLGPAVETNNVVAGADLVFVVFGTIGLEAIMKEKPVITFCRTPYGSFPDHMVRFVENIPTLSEEIQKLLDSYWFDEWALNSYIAAHMESSVRVNLFTGLLGKNGRESSDSVSSLDDQYKQLARYTLTRIAEEQSRLNGL